MSSVPQGKGTPKHKKDEIYVGCGAVSGRELITLSDFATFFVTELSSPLGELDVD